MRYPNPTYAVASKIFPSSKGRIAATEEPLRKKSMMRYTKRTAANTNLLDRTTRTVSHRQGMATNNDHKNHNPALPCANTMAIIALRGLESADYPADSYNDGRSNFTMGDTNANTENK